MTKKQALKAVVFLTVFLWLLVTVTYIIRTNGDVKDRFTGFYAEKENTIDAILVGSSPVYPYYSAPALYGKSGIAADPVVQYMSKAQLEKSMERTRKLMQEAAKKLEFIEAAQYRDELLKMEDLMKEKWPG